MLDHRNVVAGHSLRTVSFDGRSGRFGKVPFDVWVSMMPSRANKNGSAAALKP